MPPRNALSPAPYSNQLMNSVPSPGWERQVVASKPPGYTMSEWLNELQYGLGKGLGQAEAGNLEFYHDVATRPVGVYEDLVSAAKAVARNPSIVVNGLRAIGQQAASGPRGLGEVVGGFMNPRNFLRRKPVTSELDVYHGTPHTFEPEAGAPLGRFRSSKIGTGEGAQKYGYGLYFAESPNVAGSYAVPERTYARLHHMTPFEEQVSDYLDKGFSPTEMFYEFSNRGYKIPKDMAETPFDNLLHTIENLKSKDKSNNVYKVDLPDAKIEQMLDWDKPLSQQSKSVREALASLGDTQETISRYDESLLGALQGSSPDPGVLPKNPSGGDIVEQLQRKYGKAGASEYLRSLGIPGIKYLDAGSRNGGKGTRNFVVFPGEEQHLTILSRD